VRASLRGIVSGGVNESATFSACRRARTVPASGRTRRAPPGRRHLQEAPKRPDVCSGSITHVRRADNRRRLRDSTSRRGRAATTFAPWRHQQPSSGLALRPGHSSRGSQLAQSTHRSMLGEVALRFSTRHAHRVIHSSSHTGAGVDGRYSLHRHVQGVRSLLMEFPLMTDGAGFGRADPKGHAEDSRGAPAVPTNLSGFAYDPPLGRIALWN
jgi:hypothetical protein